MPTFATPNPITALVEIVSGAVHVVATERDDAVATVSPAVRDEPEPIAPMTEADDDGGTWRVTLRVPESLRSPVDAAARAEGLSVNAWLVRAVASALGGRRHPRANTDKRFSGWVR